MPSCERQQVTSHNVLREKTGYEPQRPARDNRLRATTSCERQQVTSHNVLRETTGYEPQRPARDNRLRALRANEREMLEILHFGVGVPTPV